MQYRNRGQRCKHGFMVGVVSCHVCQPPKYTRWKTIRSEGGHVVNNNRIGRPKKIGEGTPPVDYARRGRAG